MTRKQILVWLGVLILVVFVYSSFQSAKTNTNLLNDNNAVEEKTKVLNTAPELVALSGTYVCLPPLQENTKTADCAFGIYSDEGEYYAVNFGASAGSMADFRDGAHITAKGTIILRESLKPDSWTGFNMKGLFTVMEKM